jgi:hypothetical protein
MTSNKWNSLVLVPVQINHVNPCRVPKKSVVITTCTVKLLAPQIFTVHVCTRQLLKRTMPNIQLIHCHIAR